MTARRGSLSLFHLLDPDVLADPYPLYAQLRQESPVLWDRFLHAWVLTRYDDVVEVLGRFGAECTPSPDRLAELGMQRLAPVAEIMVKQMLFMDSPQHRRVRGLASHAFTARRVEKLREHIRNIADGLIHRVIAYGEMDLMSDFAGPLPAIVSAELSGLPTQDHEQLKEWSQTFAQILGNFQNNPDGIDEVLERNVGHDRVPAARLDAKCRRSHGRTDWIAESSSGARGSAYPRRSGGEYDHYHGGCRRRPRT